MKKTLLVATMGALLMMTFQSLALLLILAGQSFAFDMARDANAKQFTQKSDHSHDDKRPVLNLQMKRPANYPYPAGAVAPATTTAQNTPVPAQK